MEEIKNTDCNLITGLTSEEVEARVKSGLVNGLQTIKTKSVLRILIDNTFTFFNFVFFVMAIIVAAFSGYGPKTQNKDVSKKAKTARNTKFSTAC